MVKQGKNNNPREALLKALEDYGVDTTNAEGLVDGIDQFKELPADEVRVPTNGAKGNGQDKTSEVDIFDKLDELGMKTDLAEFVVNAPIERLIDSSEVPGTILMDIAIENTLNKLAEPGCTDDPWELFMFNFLTLMKGLNRKRVREAIELFQSGAEMKAMGDYGKGAFST